MTKKKKKRLFDDGTIIYLILVQSGTLEADTPETEQTFPLPSNLKFVEPIIVDDNEGGRTVVHLLRTFYPWHRS